MKVRIIGTDLPGARFDDGPHSGNQYEHVKIGVQRGRDAEQFVGGDSSEAVFDLDVTPLGPGEARGPYVQGRRGDRFLYLVWVAGDAEEMFRRAKLHLNDVPPDVWDAATKPGMRLEGRLGLTDAGGCPVCARVPAGAVRWRAARD